MPSLQRKKKVHGTQLGHHNYIPVPLFVMELIWSFVPDVNERWTGFQYADESTQCMPIRTRRQSVPHSCQN